ncbi:MAG: elongation factor G, partial [Candidatus Eisenbacteria sp.]|nr:elongation factor G [Candidatus Eisenbacteria bacterium]
IGAQKESNAEILRQPRDDSPLAALAFKIQSDKHMGKLTYVRVYSGTLNSGEVVYNSTREKRQRVGRLFMMHADNRQVVETLHAGEVGAVVGLGDTRTGDTICTEKHPVVLESIEFPAPVIGLAVTPESRIDRDNLSKALMRLAEEDPTFTVTTNQETGDVIISGMGELHLEIIVDRLKREFNVNTQVGKPQVAYRETVVGSVEHVHKLVKQTGGHGQYAHVKIEVRPAVPGSGLHFEDRVTGGRIPKEYIPAVERGVVDAMAKGPYAGFPMVDVFVVLLDGSSHDVDSSEMAFRTCARQAFRDACKKAGLQLLEPVMSVEVTAPEDHTGAITGSLCSKRGQIIDMESRGKASITRARVPLAEMFGYSSELRNATSGRGEFTMQFEHYEAVPYALAEEIVEARRKAKSGK